MLQVIIAILGGALTIGAPCILPLLPILLGASIGQTSKRRPLFIALGFVIMFSITGLALSFLVTKLNIAPDALRSFAIVALGVFGAFMIIPGPFERLVQALSGLIGKAQGLSQKAGSGNMGGFVLGMILGLIWTPCAGPILGSILTLIATQADFGKAAVLLTAYAIGAGIPMLLIAYGGQAVTANVRILSHYTVIAQKIFGGIIILLAVAMYFQYDLKLQTKLLEFYQFPSFEEQIFAPKKESREEVKKTSLPIYGQAPEFAGISKWLNTEKDLRLTDLRGKVVLVDFWTYSCINCIRTLPHLTKWHETYKDKGFVIIGVHTPEFPFEKVTKNVQTALSRYDIRYPVAQDNDFKTWTAYQNRYWPAHYLIDQEGNVRYTHFGEGKYEETERAIQELLGEDSAVMKKADNAKRGAIKTPEIYFGTDRLEALTPSQRASATARVYTLPSTLESNHFALEGKWRFEGDKIILQEGKGKIRMKFYAGKIHMVANVEGATTLSVSVDGQEARQIPVQGSDLYTLFSSEDYREHEVLIEVPSAGFEAYTFTFG